VFVRPSDIEEKLLFESAALAAEGIPT